MKTTPLFFLLFALGSILPLAAQTQSPAGVQLYSFRHEFEKDVRGTLQKIKDMGITKVEMAGFFNLSAKECKKLLDEFGMTAEGISASFEDLQNPEKVKMAVENAKIMGATHVMCAWIPHQEHDFNIGDVKKAAAVFNEAGKTMAASGISLLYHTHGYEFRPYLDHYLMDELIAGCNPRYINFEMDLLWVYHPGHNPVTWLKKYPTRWKSFHLKDRRKGTDGNQNGRMDEENDVTLGTGDLNLEDIFKQIQTMKITKLYIEDESPRTVDQVPKSIEYLKKYFK